MKYLLDIPALDLRAFMPSAGRMRLYGGKSDAPAPPDYIGQANATAAGNLATARAQTSANRVNQVTPYGSIKYTQGNGFNQEGYDTAIKNYADTAAAFNDPNNQAMGQYRAMGGKMPDAPTRDQFIIDPDKWSSQIDLSDTGQQLLDSYNRTSLGMADLQGIGMDRVRQSFAQPFDTSGLIDLNERTGMDGWDRASDLIMQRMNPDLDAQQAALDTKLANQGLSAGSEGWGQQQYQFGKQRNDAGVAAQLAGSQTQNQMFQQALAGNAATLQQRAFLRSLPLQELNALRTGSQVTNPTFSTPGNQGQTSGPDLLGASQSAYNTQLGAVNAQNAQAASTTGAAVGALGTAAGAYAGSASGSAALGSLFAMF